MKIIIAAKPDYAGKRITCGDCEATLELELGDAHLQHRTALTKSWKTTCAVCSATIWFNTEGRSTDRSRTVPERT